MTSLFSGIFDTAATAVIDPGSFLLCIAVSLLVGLFLGWVYTYRNRYTKSFVVTLSLLPAIVCVVIMMVNGNIGAGVAVAGAFSLVRFRSAQGTARDIGMIFLAMGCGLIAGMGYLAYACLFGLLIGGVMVLYTFLGLGENKNNCEKNLRITIPEDLDYTDVFADIMKEYCLTSNLVTVKTANMGSVYKLTYDVTLRDPAREKLFIDELRTRNGNLEITISNQMAVNSEL